ncbi:restriction endonuclease subunit S [Enterobacter hormaechei subsp. xiangfangensis]|uniref:restriction endonuclease subunit S n=1 Tax=Enterobacter cloacae complex TaxID=354276 RepID=UPI00177E8754|nr:MULTISPECIES: restriction endonuclease subunit S [Enterobacter cloacae complex]ELE9220874.1 restriction endonuclease subunit S [Enterobacter kobei]HAK9674510.1 restriction endonuclease subunit S [Escherichia coli]MBD8459757.1 restriction endonuclease subunit S [Enterobacter cloacae]MCB4611683.1 restriction endonuclease subunit S [Enterobacter asburiae]MCF2227906.1 restriction endonuclease subunit S [Enterobacter cloacae]
MSFELYEYKIEDLGKVITGKTPPSKISDAFSAQGIPFVTPKDMDGRRLIDKTERYLSSQGVEAVRNCLLPQNSIAVSCIGSDMGKTVLLPGESITNQQINAIVVDSEHFDYKYVYYYLSTLQDDFKAIAGGSATPILNKGHFSQFKVSLPVKPVQNKIALILDSLDTKIEVNTEINHTLEQMAQALFKSWFVDFEPVKAKMAVLESGGSQADAMLAAMTAISGKDADALAVFEREHPEQYAELKATAELFPSAMQDSELGNIPVTWELGKLQDLLVLQRGFDLPSSARKDGEFPLIAASGPNGTHNVAMAKAPGVITGRSGVLGKVYLTLEDYWPLNTTLWVKEFKRATPCYAYELLRLLDMKAFNAGSAVPSLNRNHIHSLSYPLPPMALVNLFESSALLLHQRAHVNLKHSQSLALLRDTLLPKLLSGEITLPEAELAVSEAENV